MNDRRVDLVNSLALRALARQRKITSPVWVLGRWLVRLGAVGSLLGALMGVVGLGFFPTEVVAMFLMVAGVSLTLLVIDFYLIHRWSAFPELMTTPTNLADALTPEATRLVDRALREKIPLLAAGQQTEIVWLLQRLGLVGGPEMFTPLDLALIIERSADDQQPHIDDASLVIAACQLDTRAQAILQAQGLTIDDVREAANWLRRLRKWFERRPLWQESAGAGIAADWTSGYTPFLANFVEDLTNVARTAGHTLQVAGRDGELDRVDAVLTKSRGHNLLLIGPTGVGKETLILGLAQRIIHGQVSAGLANQHLLQLDLGAVLAGVSDRGEIEARLLQIFSEAARAGNTILVIPDLHLLVGGGERIGGVDATDILVQALRSPNLRIIATTTPEEFQARLVPKTSLIGLLERIDLAPPAPGAVLEILENTVLGLEMASQVLVLFGSLKTIRDIADRYVTDQVAPANALNLLSEVVSAAETHNETIITSEFVKRVLSEKLNIRLETATAGEREKLVNLEMEFHRTVVDQEEAITALAVALRRARAGLASGERPIASFLFLGPTGVGKTETAKALARVYFGGEDKMIRFDMTEYSQPDSLVRLMGAVGADGTKIGGLLADQVHDHPFSLVLLDEFEKAHSQILNLFLQILDEGRLTDGTGRVIDFTNTIIIATSNAGAELIRESISAGEDHGVRRKKLLDYLQSSGIYKPELVNRFDGVIAFRPLAPEHVKAIVELMLGELSAKLKAEQQITLSFAPDLVEGLAAAGFDPQFGARPIRRLIQDKVESYLANGILTGAIAKGESVTITAETIGLNKSI